MVELEDHLASSIRLRPVKDLIVEVILVLDRDSEVRVAKVAELRLAK